MGDRVGRAASKLHDHVVKVYDDEMDLVGGVAEFVIAGIVAGDLVVVLATPAHRAELFDAAAASGANLAAATKRGQYVALDASEMLAAFMVEGVPDRSRFNAVIGGVLGSGSRDVRVFGEMVSVLWDAGDVSGAIALESLWNDLASEHALSLYCAYALASFGGADLHSIRQVCDHHHDIVAPDSYVTPPGPSATIDEMTSSELFLPVPSAVRAARRFLDHHVQGWGDAGLVADASVVVSELATNAVRHARSPFRLSLLRGNGSLRVAVTDAGGGAPEPREAALDVTGGRGLALVASLGSAWGMEPALDGKTIWVELAHAPVGEPAIR